MLGEMKDIVTLNTLRAAGSIGETAAASGTVLPVGKGKGAASKITLVPYNSPSKTKSSLANSKSQQIERALAKSAEFLSSGASMRASKDQRASSAQGTQVDKRRQSSNATLNSTSHGSLSEFSGAAFPSDQSWFLPQLTLSSSPVSLGGLGNLMKSDRDADHSAYETLKLTHNPQQKNGSNEPNLPSSSQAIANKTLKQKKKKSNELKDVDIEECIPEGGFFFPSLLGSAPLLNIAPVGMSSLY